jgi:tRNA nucleotidyltransferase (CCA-adding enzyme)
VVETLKNFFEVSNVFGAQMHSNGGKGYLFDFLMVLELFEGLKINLVKTLPAHEANG